MLFRSCAVVTGGEARCWGDGTKGQLGDGRTERSTLPVAVRTGPSTVLAGVVAVAAGGAHACALLTDGTVACWGDGGSGQLGDGTRTGRAYAAVVPGLTGVAAIGAGATHTCALLTTKTVRCWGLNAYVQLGDGSATLRTRPVAVRSLAGVTAIDRKSTRLNSSH